MSVDTLQYEKKKKIQKRDLKNKKNKVKFGVLVLRRIKQILTYWRSSSVDQ